MKTYKFTVWWKIFVLSCVSNNLELYQNFWILIILTDISTLYSVDITHILFSAEKKMRFAII